MAQRHCSGPSLSQALFFSEHSCANFPCLQAHHYLFSLFLLPAPFFYALSSTFNSMGLHNIHSGNHSLINTSNSGPQQLSERTQNLYWKSGPGGQLWQIIFVFCAILIESSYFSKELICRKCLLFWHWVWGILSILQHALSRMEMVARGIDGASRWAAFPSPSKFREKCIWN